jgi:hypothetical protein
LIIPELLLLSTIENVEDADVPNDCHWNIPLYANFLCIDEKE